MNNGDVFKMLGRLHGGEGVLLGDRTFCLSCFSPFFASSHFSTGLYGIITFLLGDNLVCHILVIYILKAYLLFILTSITCTSHRA